MHRYPHFYSCYFYYLSLEITQFRCRLFVIPKRHFARFDQKLLVLLKKNPKLYCKNKWINAHDPVIGQNRSAAEPHQHAPSSSTSVIRTVRFTVETARLRMETNTPTAPWAAFSCIMLYWEAFTAVLFHNTGRHAALWELPLYNSSGDKSAACTARWN